jgi:hypothetical protein
MWSAVDVPEAGVLSFFEDDCASSLNFWEVDDPLDLGNRALTFLRPFFISDLIRKGERKGKNFEWGYGDEFARRLWGPCFDGG